MQEPGRILVVEAQSNFRDALSETLRERGHQVTAVASGAEALQVFDESPTALVIADARAAGLEEAEFVKRVCARDPAAQVILTSATPSAQTAFEAMRSGAFDYLFKPFGNFEVVARVAEKALEKRSAAAADRRRLADLEQRNERLERATRIFVELGRRDPLTGLFDAVHFRERLIGEAARMVRKGGTFSVAVLDIDDLEGVNRRFGRQAGDAVLVEVAAILRGRLRRSDLPARHGTRDFALLLPETAAAGATVLAEELRERISVRPIPALSGEGRSGATVSVGVAEFANRAAAPELVLRAAEAALGRAKDGGRNQVCLAPPPAGGEGAS